MFKQTHVKIEKLTPELVQRFRNLEHLEGDRDQESTHGQQRIAWLATLCRNGAFYSPDWAVANCQGRQYRINGGHSSNMLASANGYFPKNLPVILRWFECDSYSDVVELFNHFDNRKSSRTSTDKAKVHKSIHEQLDSVAPSFINRMLAGIQCFNHDGKSACGDEDERTKLIHTETEFLAWAGRYVKTLLLGRPGVIACMYRSFYADSLLAEKFWSMVFEESAPTPKHPTRVLAKFLRDLNAPANKDRWDSRALYVKCIHAWNAWQNGEITELKYHPSASVPKLLIVTNGKSTSY